MCVCAFSLWVVHLLLFSTLQHKGPQKGDLTPGVYHKPVDIHPWPRMMKHSRTCSKTALFLSLLTSTYPWLWQVKLKATKIILKNNSCSTSCSMCMNNWENKSRLSLCVYVLFLFFVLFCFFVLFFLQNTLKDKQQRLRQQYSLYRNHSQRFKLLPLSDMGSHAWRKGVEGGGGRHTYGKKNPKEDSPWFSVCPTCQGKGNNVILFKISPQTAIFLPGFYIRLI